MEKFYTLMETTFPDIKSYTLDLPSILPDLSEPTVHLPSLSPQNTTFDPKKNIYISKSGSKGHLVYTGHIDAKTHRRNGLGYEYHSNNQPKFEAVFIQDNLSEEHITILYNNEGQRVFIGFMKDNQFKSGIIYDSAPPHSIRFIGSIEDSRIDGPNNYIFNDKEELICFGGFSKGVPADEKFHILYPGGEYIWFIGHAFENESEGPGWILHPCFYTLSEQFFPLNRYTRERRCLINAKTLKDFIELKNNLTRLLPGIKERTDVLGIRESLLCQIYISTHFKKFAPHKLQSKIHPNFSFFRYLQDANIIFSSTSPVIGDDLDFYRECLYYGRNLWLDKDIPFQTQPAPFATFDILNGKVQRTFTKSFSFKGVDGTTILDGKLDAKSNMIARGSITDLSIPPPSNGLTSPT
jgi:hypothetical protein